MWNEESQTASYIDNPVLDSGNTRCCLVWQCRCLCKKTGRCKMGNNVGQLIYRRGVLSLVCCALGTPGFSLPARMQIHVLKALAWVWVKGCSVKGYACLWRHAVWICTIKFMPCEAHVFAEIASSDEFVYTFHPLTGQNSMKNPEEHRDRKANCCLSLLLPLSSQVSFSVYRHFWC